MLILVEAFKGFQQNRKLTSNPAVDYTQYYYE